jgi:hypothetical protein
MSRVRALSLLALGLTANLGVASRRAAAEETMADVKTLVEGVYQLREWRTAQGVLRPPAVDGRFVLGNGAVVTLLRNGSQPASKVSVAAFGSYILDGSGFSYRYEDSTVATETPTEARVSHQPLFEGTRSFTVAREADGVRCKRAEGGIEFFFTPQSLTYSENGKVLRVWQRTNAR